MRFLRLEDGGLPFLIDTKRIESVVCSNYDGMDDAPEYAILFNMDGDSHTVVFDSDKERNAYFTKVEALLNN